MAYTLRSIATCAVLIMGASALQLAVDEKVCGEEQTPYEMISPLYPGVCTVYCVPGGECEGQAQTGKLNYLGINREGNCKSKGYTESASMGNVTLLTSKWLSTLQGPCKGMTLSKFQKPAVAEQKMFLGGKICKGEQKAYEAISKMFPGVCSVFCVPQGQCEGQVLTGKMNYLGITAEGTCKQYPETGKLGSVTQGTVDWLQTLQGPCKGMTLTKFQQPGAEDEDPKSAQPQSKTAAGERICGEEQTPYEMISPLYPGACTVFCVPGGECEGQAQTGKLNYLGITGEGNCKGKGYTESAKKGNLTAQTSKWLSTLQGPCKGMTLSKFQKPTPDPNTDEKKPRTCGDEQRPYEMITPMFPGVCTVFCVPDGECEGQAQLGKLSYLGITGEGNCRSKGYTESAALGNLTVQTQRYLKTLKGPCKGMTLAKFQKPGM